MGFLVSPGVDVNEIDLTNVIPAVSTSIGGIVGHFKWGPVEEVVSVGSEKELVANFGEPDNNTYKQWFQAAAFLQYGNALNVYRYDVGLSSGAKNATWAGNRDLNIKNKTDFEASYSGIAWEDSPLDSPDLPNYFAAKYPGALGNSIQVAVITNNNFSGHDQAGFFNGLPGGDSSPEDDTLIHIAVIDKDGKISGTAGTVLETYSSVSVTTTAKSDDGTNNYYVDVINERSAWIWANSVEKITGTESTADLNATFAGGADGTAPSTANLQAVYTTAFGDAETLDVNILIAPTGVDSTEIGYAAANAVFAVAASRKDCVAVASPPTTGTGGTALQALASTAVTNAKNWAAGITSSSYGILSSTAVYVYDKYNDVYRWIGSAGHVAGLLANVDDVAEPWFSPAGYNRGQLRGVVKLGYNPTSSQRDDLYKARVNPLVSFPGQGTLLFGDKTAQSKPSAFDRINVRRLFIVLEKAISTASKYQLFELNDEFTRAMFRNMTEPFLRDVKGRRGVTDFLVVCDETNNTGEVIDTNRFVADIYIKPARSINFITLNFIATRTGVEFSEVAGQQ